MVDFRDIKDWDLKKAFAYTPYNVCCPKPDKEYMLIEDLERIKKSPIPFEDIFSGNANYYSKTGKFRGSGTFNYFIKNQEIVEYLLQDEEYVKRSVKEGKTWWLPSHIRDTFLM